MDQSSEESSEWSGSSDGEPSADDIAHELAPKRKRKDQKNDKKPAKKLKTSDESNELTEAPYLYTSNLFSLQVDEILKEIKIKNKAQKQFDTWWLLFKAKLQELPEYDPIPISDIKSFKCKKTKSSAKQQLITDLAKHLDEFNTDQDLSLKFMKPEEMDMFGLYKMQALPGPFLYVNVNLVVPAACFHAKDYQNNRYFVRKYSYLGYIAHFLAKQDICDAIKLARYLDNNQWPIIEVVPKDSKKVVVRIFATPSADMFKKSRFLPNINNVKDNVFGAKVIDVEALKNTATPYYNASLAHDCTLALNAEYIASLIDELPNAKEAIKLIKVWLRQRQLSDHFETFTDEMVLYFMSYLVLKQKINIHMSSCQAVRIFWNFMSETDLTKNPISLCEGVPAEQLDHFKQAFEVVFLDKSGAYNVTAFLSGDFYKKLKYECSIGFKLLEDESIHSFHSLFIAKLPVELQYDLIISVKDQKQFSSIIDRTTDEEKTTFLGHHRILAVKHISQTLHKGLSKRAQLIVPHFINNNLHFGIILDPSTAFSILELGPEFTDPKEKEFREFWENLSSDRRFKDGSLCVAVYFETKTIKDKRDIIKKMIHWVMHNKLQLKYTLQYDIFDDLLCNKKVVAPFSIGTNEECCLKAIAASDDLAKKMRSLDLPLGITGVQGISDVYSFSDVFPPIPTNYRSGKRLTTVVDNNIVLCEKNNRIAPKYVKPIELVLQLEHSSKWPKDLQTLRHMKTTLFLEIAKLLSKKFNIVCSVKPQFFDVLHEGLVFRFRLHLPREIGLVKKQMTKEGQIVYKDNAESKEMVNKLDILPKITGALKGIQSQHPSYGPSTALIKRWLRSHLIDDFHFPDIVINLLNAALYTNQCPFSTSNVPQVAFLRFLRFFSELQYAVEPVIVNFNDELSKEKIAELSSLLFQKRDDFPALCIATPFDQCQSVYTRRSPTKEILRRVQQLSVEVLSCFHDLTFEQKPINIKSLFTANLDGYHMLIHLRPLLNPRRHEYLLGDEQGQITFEEYDQTQNSKMPVTDFNPVQLYLRDLRNNFSDFALFFNDTYGGNVIGVLWKPNALKDKDFQVSYVNGRKLVGEQLVLNKDALIDDFYTLGRDLVRTIDVR